MASFFSWGASSSPPPSEDEAVVDAAVSPNEVVAELVAASSSSVAAPSSSSCSSSSSSSSSSSRNQDRSTRGEMGGAGGREGKYMASECHVCEKEATFYCSVCKGVRYCCKKHQESDWVSHKKMCKILKVIMPVINEGGDPNAPIKGVQPLILACEYGLDDVARQLIERGARVDERSRNDDTALFLACIKGHDRCVRLLIEHGVDVNVPNKNRSFPLMMASHEGHAQTVAALLEGGPRSPVALLNVKDLVGSRALHYAAVKGRTDVARLLLDAGAEIDLQSADGYTALMRASYCGHQECAMLLIERGSNVNSRDTNGATALICACGKGFAPLAMKLLDHGADPLLTAGDGSTPLMLAGESRLTNVQDRLVALATTTTHIDPASVWTPGLPGRRH